MRNGFDINTCVHSPPSLSPAVDKDSVDPDYDVMKIPAHTETVNNSKIKIHWMVIETLCRASN